MQKITVYRYVREGGGVTVSPVVPAVEYAELLRLAADEGKLLTQDGETFFTCVDVSEADGWYEVDDHTMYEEEKFMHIKINDTLYPATVGRIHTDHSWDHRESRTIRLEMDAATAAALFVDDADWGVAYPAPDGADPIVEDMSDFCMAGPIVDNRDGTVTVKMGKPTDKELLEIILGGKSV